MNYYQQGVMEQKKQQQKEILSYWSTPQIYIWIGNNTVNHELIEAIIYNNSYEGISSNRIAELYNRYLNITSLNNKINCYIVDHIINTCNKYKCTFNIVGEFKKNKNFWSYDTSGIPDSYFKNHNKYYNFMKKDNKNDYVLELENKIKTLEQNIQELKSKNNS